MAATNDVEREILTYFRVHPNAMDTAEGIAAWWLDPLHLSAQVVREALDRLEAHGLIERCGRDDTPLFRLKVEP